MAHFPRPTVRLVRLIIRKGTTLQQLSALDSAPVTPSGARGAPLIGITGHRRFGQEVGRLPGFVAQEPMEVFISPYVRSVSGAGGIPVLLTRDADARAVIDRIDGLLLSGGEDVDPRRYGLTPPLATSFIDPGRDAFELELFEIALERGIPVLGVCRGCQVINVARRGTLVTDLPRGVGEEHAFGGYPGAHRSHTVSIAPDSRLAGLLGHDLRVNSFHHQAIDLPGNGVAIVGRASDGVAEAIEMPGMDVIGVQWHPEMFDRDPVFDWLVENATAAAPDRQRLRV